MHGLDVTDLGFRSVHNARGRFDNMDPLCEQAYHSSPYAISANNPVNNVDVLGLTPMKFENVYTHLKQQGLNYIVVNNDGEMLGGVDDGDDTIYLDKDGSWSEKDGKKDLKAVGKYMPGWSFADYAMASMRGGIHWRAPGWYNGQNCVSFGVTFGAAVNIKLPILKDIGVNVMSISIFGISYTLDANNSIFSNLSGNYLGQNGMLEVSQGIGLSKIIGYEHSFKVRSGGDMQYVSGSEQQKGTGWLWGLLNTTVKSDGSFELTVGTGLIVLGNINVKGNIYYEHK